MGLPLPLEGRMWSNSGCILNVILDSEKAEFLFSSLLFIYSFFGCHIGTPGRADFFQPNPGIC